MWSYLSAGFNLSADSVKDDEGTVLTYHRLAEIFKFAYAKRSALGDEEFVNITEVRIEQPLLGCYANCYMISRSVYLQQQNNLVTIWNLEYIYSIRQGLLQDIGQ